MTNQEKLYLAKQAAGGMDPKFLEEGVRQMQARLNDPNLTDVERDSVMQNLAYYQSELAKLAPPVGAETVLRNDGKTDVAPPSRQVDTEGNALDEGQLAGIEAAGTPEQHSAIQAGLGAEGFEDHPSFNPVAESKPTADAGGNSGAADAGTPWYKNPYILGAGALGLGGLGAYALSGNDDEEEEEEEAYA